MKVPIFLGAMFIGVCILLAGAGISTTLDEVCPTVDEGTTFLSAKYG